ncbi:hypothetical protein LCGC14_1826450 [marine sediment metagenome]|uniref:Uncharacterized protein n=1 Tax=marine sediment metagenome TaxID=412755 RepID=A0A0F9JGV5_9ZZZZ
MHKIYIKMPGKPVGFTDPNRAGWSAAKEYEVEKIHPVMLFGEAPNGQTFVTHNGAKMGDWMRKQKPGTIVQSFLVYS